MSRLARAMAWPGTAGPTLVQPTDAVVSGLAPVEIQDLKVQNYRPGSHDVIDVQGYLQP